MNNHGLIHIGFDTEAIEALIKHLEAVLGDLTPGMAVPADAGMNRCKRRTLFVRQKKEK